MDCLQSCVAGLCASLARRRSSGEHGYFGEGLAEVEAREGSIFIPDRLVLAEDGAPGPSEGKLGALAMAISYRLLASERRDVCLLLYRGSRAGEGPLLADVGAALSTPGAASGAIQSALERLSLRQAAKMPLEGVIAVVLAAGGLSLCPTPSLVDREMMAWHLKAQALQERG
ncbi:RNase H domain-containing protein [Durusdinium trenchii]|uniref:RNase H domain-containing protein n=1 Tax=Durusdinium trenchii TaxID=1381693 RepID=A0ABP0KZ76_9DINO